MLIPFSSTCIKDSEGELVVTSRSGEDLDSEVMEDRDFMKAISSFASVISVPVIREITANIPGRKEMRQMKKE